MLTEAHPRINGVFGKPGFSKVSSLCMCGICFLPGCKSFDSMQPLFKVLACSLNMLWVILS